MKRTRGCTPTRNLKPPPKPKKKPEPETEGIVYAELPDVRDVLERGQYLTASALLIELDSVAMVEKAAKERGDALKRELELLQIMAGTKGLRHDTYCFVASEMPGRKTLDKELLLENGVKPQVIKDSMKTGDPYIQRTFKNIAK